jgi:hypothetical protein
MAEEATREMGQMVDVYLPAKTLLAAATERVLKER